MSSRRVLVFALLGVSAYFYCDADEPAPPALLAQDAIRIDTVSASTAPEPPRPARWRAAPDATAGRISGLEMAAPVVVGVVPQASAPQASAPPPPAAPAAAATPVAQPVPVASPPPPPQPQPASALAAPPIQMVPPAASVAAAPLDPPRAPVRDISLSEPSTAERQMAALLDTARLLEQRLVRLDGRIDQLAAPRPLRPAPRPLERVYADRAPNLLQERPERIYSSELTPIDEAREVEREPLPPPAPAVDSLHGAPPALRRRNDPDTNKGFDLTVRLIRRLMQRVDRLEQSLDSSADGEAGVDDPGDPSATGLWRGAPPVRR